MKGAEKYSSDGNLLDIVRSANTTASQQWEKKLDQNELDKERTEEAGTALRLGCKVGQRDSKVAEKEIQKLRHVILRWDDLTKEKIRKEGGERKGQKMQEREGFNTHKEDEVSEK